MSALRLDRVSYRYPGARAPSLRDFDLDVAPGEFVVLAGASGSGKSTLLRAACGLVPHFHGGEAAGRVITGGLDTREHDELARLDGQSDVAQRGHVRVRIRVRDAAQGQRHGHPIPRRSANGSSAQAASATATTSWRASSGTISRG